MIPILTYQEHNYLDLTMEDTIDRYDVFKYTFKNCLFNKNLFLNN
jgi:hypothetical protein